MKLVVTGGKEYDVIERLLDYAARSGGDDADFFTHLANYFMTQSKGEPNDSAQAAQVDA